MDTIVVGYDSSDGAKRALGRAADFAERFGAKLVVTSVAEPVAISGDAVVPGDAMGLAAPAILPIPDREEATRELQEARKALEGKKIEVEYISTVGEAAEGILETAD